MKILNTTPITSSNEFPVKSGTLDFLQLAYKEQIANLFTSLVETPATDTIYIISGCINSGSGAVYNISAGVVYVNGEVYNFDGANFTLTGLQKAYARIETTQYTTNADPVTFTDGVARNVHDIRKIVIENTITSSGLPEYKDFIRTDKWLTGDIKEIAVDNTYLSANFDGTGLGKNERKGWAICNGANGTINKKGRVSIGYDSTNYPTLGATGGEKEHVLTEAEMPSHKHYGFGESVSTFPLGVSSGSADKAGSNGGYSTDNYYYGTTDAGSDQAHNNMQPYIVTLFIQKI